MNAATSQVTQFPEPEFDGGGGGDTHAHAACAEAFRDFLIMLIVRVRERGELHGAVVESELYTLIAGFADDANLPGQAEQWRAKAKDAGAPE